MTNLLLPFLVAQSLLTASQGFSFSSMAIKSQRSSTSALPASVTVFNEPEAQFHLAKAQECAFDDSCPIEECREHLHDMIHIQSLCNGGLLVGHELCEEQDQAAEIVAHLRYKIENGQAVAQQAE